MAQGDLKGTLVGAGNSITNPFSATGSVAVVVGDLVYVVFSEQTTFTGTTVSDNLGNTYASVSASTDAGNVTGQAYYSRVTTAGTLTSVSLAATASGNNAAGVAAVIEGPFTTSPLGTNPANATTDITSPFTCPATGTLVQANAVVMCFSARTGSAVFSATSPNLKANEQASQAVLSVTVGYQKVSSTASVAPEFTGTNPTQQVLGTASFKLQGAFTTTITADTVAITGQTVNPVLGFATTITADTVAITGQTVTPIYSTGGINYSTTITAGTVDVLGQTVAPVFGQASTITPDTVGVVGQTVTPIHAAFVLVQDAFRIRTDAAAVDDTPTWGAAQDVTFFPGEDVNFRVRFRVANPTGGGITSGFKLVVSKNGGADADVTVSSTNVRGADASSSVEGTAVTVSRLTGGVGTWVDGIYTEDGSTG